MDPSEPSTWRRSPKRELQGPRPSPLKVRKESHTIKKPPVAPPPPRSTAPPPQHRPPVIIYTVSPKVIHTTPSDFMSLVQRLTGASSSSSSVDASSSRPPSNVNTGGDQTLSSAARLAVIEKGARPSDEERLRINEGDHVLDQVGIDGGEKWNWPAGSFPGILSPVPSSLPLISPNFFSPSMDQQNSLNLFHELNPAYHGNMGSTPGAPSPGAYSDIFNQYQDF